MYTDTFTNCCFFYPFVLLYNCGRDLPPSVNCNIGGVIMNTTFVAKKVTLTDSFQEYAENKLKKLDRFFDDASAQVKVSAQKDTALVEITLWSEGMIFRGEKSDRDKNVALDGAVDTVIRRIRKNKTKLHKKVKSSAFEAEAAPEVEEAFELVRRKEIELKSMTTEEAILQMNLLGHSFFIFQNADDGKVNVVYRRNEEGYGLISC